MDFPNTHRIPLGWLLEHGDPLAEAAGAPEITSRLLPLPLEVIYQLGLAPAVRLAAVDEDLSDAELRTAADACWRAISRPGRKD